MIRRILFALLFLGAIAYAPKVVYAQDAPQPTEPSPPPAQNASEQQAAELKAKGDDAMLDLRYDDALRFYTDAYALDPKPALLYNLGRAHQARGSFPQALAHLERFQVEAPPELRERVPQLTELLAQVRSKITTLSVRCNVPGATVLVGNREIGKAPIDAIAVNAGPAKITVSARDHETVVKQVLLPGGKPLSLAINLRALANSTILAVRSPVLGADVFVDGKHIGVVPAELSVTPGKHSIVVKHEDYEEARTSTVVKPGARKVVDVDLVALPGIHEEWWFWTGIGAVAAGVTVIVVAAVSEGPDVDGTIAPGIVQAPLISF